MGGTFEASDEPVIHNGLSSIRLLAWFQPPPAGNKQAKSSKLVNAAASKHHFGVLDVQNYSTSISRFVITITRFIIIITITIKQVYYYDYYNYYSYSYKSSQL